MNPRTLLIAAAIILSPFQDTALANTPIGFLGRSLSFVPLLILLPYQLGDLLRRVRDPIIGACAAVTLINTGAVILAFNGAYLGDSLVYKAIANLVLQLLIIAPFYAKISSPDSLRIPVLIALAITILGYFAVDFAGITAVDTGSFFHATINGQMRARGFALEASIFSTQVIVLAAMAAHFMRNKLLAPWLFGGSILFVIVVTNSKGALPAVLVAGLLSLRLSPLRCVMLLIASPIIYLILADIVIPDASHLFANDLQQGTSSATRLTAGVATVLTLQADIFGYGLGGLAIGLHEHTRDALNWVQHHSSGELNFVEVYDMFVQPRTAFYLTGKTGLFDMVLTMGVVGIALFCAMIIRPLFYFELKRDFYLYFALAFSAVALATYVPLLGLYHFIPVYLVANALIRRQHESRVKLPRKQTNGIEAVAGVSLSHFGLPRRFMSPRTWPDGN